MLDAKNMWMAIAAFALVLLGWKALSPQPPAGSDEPYAVVTVGYGAELRVEKITRAQ